MMIPHFSLDTLIKSRYPYLGSSLLSTISQRKNSDLKSQITSPTRTSVETSRLLKQPNGVRTQRDVRRPNMTTSPSVPDPEERLPNYFEYSFLRKFEQSFSGHITPVHFTSSHPPPDDLSYDPSIAPVGTLNITSMDVTITICTTPTLSDPQGVQLVCGRS